VPAVLLPLMMTGIIIMLVAIISSSRSTFVASAA
jgi:hypothetical protein